MFEHWMKRVDSILLRTVGVTSGDLPDACLYDWYDDELTPRQAAQLLIEAGL